MSNKIVKWRIEFENRAYPIIDGEYEYVPEEVTVVSASTSQEAIKKFLNVPGSQEIFIKSVELVENNNIQKMVTEIIKETLFEGRID